VLNQLLAYYGEEEIRRRVQGLLERGSLRFRETIVEESAPPEENERDLIQISLERI
jgi:hypothetical protein